MKRGKIIAATLISVSLVVGGLASNVFAETGASAPVLIVEVQTGSSTSASQEFIELANTTTGAVDVSEWRVEYFSATQTSLTTPSRVIPLHGTLPAGAHYLLASTGYLVGSANDSFSAGLAAGGGHLRLVSLDADNEKVYDLLGWGTATMPEGRSAIASPAGQAIVRKTDVDNAFIDSDDNSQDFSIASPSPEGYIPEPDQPDTDGRDSGDTDGDTAPTSPAEPDESPELVTASAPVQLDITELFPNPASPLTDASDEFIEIYNPSDNNVELTGYKLQTGNTYNHSYEFNDELIGPRSYKAFYVRDTGVVLANSASKARLLGPNGLAVSETDNYTDAPEGQSWAWSGDDWQWSTTTTPGQINQITAPSKEEASKSEESAKMTKKASTRTATPKSSVRKASAKAVKSAKVNGKGAGNTQASTVPSEPTRASIHPGVLAGVGSLAVLYGAYEYRSDFANFFHRLRRNRKSG